jgi:hypothetical protein
MKSVIEDVRQNNIIIIMLLKGYNNQQEMYCEILQSNDGIITLLEEYDCVIDSRDNLKLELSTLMEERERSKLVQVDLKLELSTLIEKRKKLNVESKSIKQSDIRSESDREKSEKLKIIRFLSIVRKRF